MFNAETVRAFASVIWSHDGQCGVTFETPLSDEDVELLRSQAGVPSLASLTAEERLALEEWITGKAR